MIWTVNIRKKAIRNLARLPEKVRNSLKLLIKEIEISGPVRGNWPNYSLLSENRHHCHLKKGHPTYVAVWDVTDKEIKLVEVSYVGTHERAPY
ncbi:MAG: cytotoxic translational repressor of toxin-antitoxin stability system [Desulfobacteraceae bacterium 4572_88]|nr:MAG: cytotoxic translational repressor of toxin-antitoxin stability system [Desulfobacteraceae bacterium 4572_88]